MKPNYLIRFIPIVSTFLLIFFLSFSNQKVNTKLRILIWDTPSLSLGTYLAISTGAGFLISYVVTNNLANIIRLKSKQTIKYKQEYINKESNEYNNSNTRNSTENILIERDINEPSPTMNAEFRVIGKTEKYNTNYINSNTEYDKNNELEESSNNKNYRNESINPNKVISNDWNDDSFTNW